MSDSEKFDSHMTLCCRQCGDELSAIDNYGVVVTINEFDGVELDSPHRKEFCSLDCFRQWANSDPELLDDDR